MRHSFYSLVNVIKEEEEKRWRRCGFNINSNYGVQYKDESMICGMGYEVVVYLPVELSN